MNPVLTSVAFGSNYIGCMDRLRQSIKQHSPDADVLFYENVLPPGARLHDVSPYGFKIHAIREAAKKSDKVVWVDATCYLVSDVENYYKEPRYKFLQDKAVLAAQDDNKLYGLASPELLSSYGVSIETAKQQLHLVGGSLYVFDFSLEKSRKIFEMWAEMENRGLFHSSTFPGHRHDEACMSIALYLNGSCPVDYYESGYRCDTIVNKDHWKDHQ